MRGTRVMKLAHIVTVKDKSNSSAFYLLDTYTCCLFQVWMFTDEDAQAKYLSNLSHDHKCLISTHFIVITFVQYIGEGKPHNCEEIYNSLQYVKQHFFVEYLQKHLPRYKKYLRQ